MNNIKIFIYKIIAILWVVDNIVMLMLTITLLINSFFYFTGASTWDESFKGVNWFFFVGLLFYWCLSTVFLILVEVPASEN